MTAKRVGNKRRAMSSLSGFMDETYLIFFQKGSAYCSIWGVDNPAILKQIKDSLTGLLANLNYFTMHFFKPPWSFL